MAGGVLAAALLVAASVAVTSAVAAPPAAQPSPTASPAPRPPALVSAPEPIERLLPVCERQSVIAALQAGDDEAAIAAMGGGEAMRQAVVAGDAPCVDLRDPARVWMVVDKTRPYVPIDFQPASLARVRGIRVFNAGILRTDAGAAMTRMFAAASKEGAGRLAITSGFRSYGDQARQYRSQIATKGRSSADEVSARPGYSEHQSGLAADVVACGSGGCSSIEHFGSTKQGGWVAANSWRYGFVVRYEKGRTKVTGYSPEPWHIRYVGPALAKAYHDGGFHTLEEFWGLPAAPGYGD